MSKKSSQSKQKKRLITIPSQTDRWFDLIGQQLLHGDYAGAVDNCERLLSYLPRHSAQRADALEQLGTAHAMLQNFAQSYDAYTEAVEITPNNAEFWFNRGMASRFTSRFGRSLRDFERAAELNGNGNSKSDLAKKLHEELKVGHKLARGSMKMRGPNFTLDQLIEQEDLFQRGFKTHGNKQMD
jgi:tetratricopeptide (TPR) repeat protein